MTRKTNTQLAAEAKLKHDKYTRKAKEAVVANDPAWKRLAHADRALRAILQEKDFQWSDGQLNAIGGAVDTINAEADRIAGIE